MAASVEVEPIYPVKETARRIGISEGRVYQLIAAGEDSDTPTDGQYLLTASHEHMLQAGVNPDIVVKPKHWIPLSEIRRFKGLKRR